MNRIGLIILLLSAAFSLKAQVPDTVRLSLEDAISRARIKSPQARVAINEFRNSYWEYQSYKAEFLPFLSFNGTLPNLNRSIEGVTQPDGTEIFTERALMNNTMSLNIDQNITPTGGDIFVQSNLNRLDVLTGNQTLSYLTNPLTIGYRQPIFAFNRFRWLKKTEPLKYKEAKQRYLERMERVNQEITNLFFDYYIATVSVIIADNNRQNNDTLYKISQGRYNIGKIAENELLQMELSLLNSNLEYERSLLTRQNAMNALAAYLGYPSGTPIEVYEAAPPELDEVETDIALSEAGSNRSDMLQFERQVIEAERDVNRAVNENNLSVNLFTQFGYTQSAGTLEEAYTTLEDQQLVNLGIQIPILDWGRGKASIEMAKANRDLVMSNLSQQKINFQQEVLSAVQNFNIQSKQYRIATRADSVAQKRYDITKQRFYIGKIDITDLNLALSEKDRARQAAVQALRQYWISFYRVRELTLYDFEQKLEISVQEAELL